MLVQLPWDFTRAFDSNCTTYSTNCSIVKICWEQDVLVTTERGQMSRPHHHNVNKKHRAREAQRRQLFKFLREKERVVDINSPRAVFAQREKAVGTKFYRGVPICLPALELHTEKIVLLVVPSSPTRLGSFSSHKS